MNQQRLITLISEHPQLWDRNNEKFRDVEFKNETWKKIGFELNSSGTACKDAFKALREKYIREREKIVQFNGKCNKWKLLDQLSFLDPYIIPRRSFNKPVYLSEAQDFENSTMQFNHMSHNNDTISNPEEFCRNLIALVRNSRPIWDRQYKDYHNKNLKEQLWQTIALALKIDVNICMLRWKALREKYIRQKQKYNEGEGKWVFLDDMSFLDNVIQYRRKHWQLQESYNSSNFSLNKAKSVTSDSEMGDDQTSQSASSTGYSEYNYQNIPTSSTHSEIEINEVKSEALLLANSKQNIPDSTLDLSRHERKRSCSTDCNEVIKHKQSKCDEEGQNKRCDKEEQNEGCEEKAQDKRYDDGGKSKKCDEEVQNKKSPEQIFGDLVASMLSTKTTSQKNRAMVEIMQILTNL